MLKSFHLALKSIWSNKMRSFLTMLGIIIGVAAVIILVGLVNGQMSYMKDSFSSMGTNQLNVNLVNLSTRSVSDDEMYEFYEENREYFDQMSPSVSVSGTVKYGNESLTGTTISGVSEEYLELKKQDLTAGRFLQYSDLISRQKVCVIGYYLASELCGGAQNAIGETIHINGEGYTVVGCVERQTSESDEVEEGGSDDFIYLPYTAAVKLSRNGTINNYVFTVKDTGDTEIVKTLLSDFLYPIFKNEDLYRITAMSELLDSLDSMIAMMSMMLGGIAGISLLVAGVGVMNIMLVSVTERTREIGIRKSLGAKKGTILQQFVIEAAVTSSIGGLVGIAAGCVLTGVIGNFMGMTAVPTLGSILLSFGVSVGIGLLFGYMPARRAAGLNPIDALRSE
ncbi:MAG: ABC transporter permease [Clostridium sp.]|nr:ABC transporter permease [Clostridiaceae bacterium]MDD6073104.1 ABC transporter permease [Clostridium sp.]MDY5482870.1 ABC transporter permease [Clostridium sp.]